MEWLTSGHHVLEGLAEDGELGIVVLGAPELVERHHERDPAALGAEHPPAHPPPRAVVVDPADVVRVGLRERLRELRALDAPRVLHLRQPAPRLLEVVLGEEPRVLAARGEAANW
jgi:hypothetical protein